MATTKKPCQQHVCPKHHCGIYFDDVHAMQAHPDHGYQSSSIKITGGKSRGSSTTCLPTRDCTSIAAAPVSFSPRDLNQTAHMTHQYDTPNLCSIVHMCQSKQLMHLYMVLHVPACAVSCAFGWADFEVVLGAKVLPDKGGCMQSLRIAASITKSHCIL